MTFLEPVPATTTTTSYAAYALDEQRIHDPQNKITTTSGASTAHYTRHPCDVYELATCVLYLLDRGRTDA